MTFSHRQSLSLWVRSLVVVSVAVLSSLPSVAFAFEVDGVSTSSVPWGLHVITDTVEVFQTNSIRSFQLNTYRYSDDINFLTKRCIPVDETGYYEVEDVINYGYYSVAYIQQGTFTDGACSVSVDIGASQIAVLWGYGSDVEVSNQMLVASVVDFADSFKVVAGFAFTILSAVLVYLIARPI